MEARSFSKFKRCLRRLNNLRDQLRLCSNDHSTKFSVVKAAMGMEYLEIMTFEGFSSFCQALSDEQASRSSFYNCVKEFKETLGKTSAVLNSILSTLEARRRSLQFVQQTLYGKLNFRPNLIEPRFRVVSDFARELEYEFGRSLEVPTNVVVPLNRDVVTDLDQIWMQLDELLARTRTDFSVYEDAESDLTENMGLTSLFVNGFVGLLTEDTFRKLFVTVPSCGLSFSQVAQIAGHLRRSLNMLELLVSDVEEILKSRRELLKKSSAEVAENLDTAENVLSERYWILTTFAIKANSSFLESCEDDLVHSAAQHE